MLTVVGGATYTEKFGLDATQDAMKSGEVSFSDLLL